ncbi:unnamed protein product, partial [Linum tenue]
SHNPSFPSIHICSFFPFIWTERNQSKQSRGQGTSRKLFQAQFLSSTDPKIPNFLISR